MSAKACDLDEERWSLLVQNALTVDVNTYILLRVNQGLNAFCGKECPGREAHWLNTWVLSEYLISMENSGFLCFVADCHSSLSGVSWLCVFQSRKRQAGSGPTPTVLDSEILGFVLAQPYQFFSLVALFPLPHPAHLGLKEINGGNDCGWNKTQIAQRHTL